MSFSWNPEQGSFYPKHDWNLLFQKLATNTRRYVPVYTKRYLVLSQGPIRCFKCGVRTDFVQWQMQGLGWRIDYVFTHVMIAPHKPTVCVQMLPSNIDPLEDHYDKTFEKNRNRYENATVIPNFDLVKGG